MKLQNNAWMKDVFKALGSPVDFNVNMKSGL